MEIANIVLEYLKVLVNWPLVVLALAMVFREPISLFLKKIRKIGFPGGSLDAEADEASSEVDQVSVAAPRALDSAESTELVTSDEAADKATPSQSEALPVEREEEPVEKGVGDERESEDDPRVKRDSRLNQDLIQRRKNLDEGQYYESYRQLALTSPEDAVREAYQRVRLSGRRLLQDAGAVDNRHIPSSLSVMVEQLAERDLISADAAEPARRLDRIYASAHSNELSAKGALSFVDAAQKLDFLLLEARGFFMHRRRSRMKQVVPKIERLLQEYGFLAPTVKVTLLSTAILVRFAHRAPEPGSEPRHEDLMQELGKLARHVAVPIRVRHSGSELTLNFK